jgi:hypothetical protein
MAKDLYIYSQAYAAAVELYNDAESPEEEFDALQLLRQIEEPLQEKASNICKIIRNITVKEIEADEAEIERLKDRVASATRRRDNLKAYLKEALEGADIKKLELDHFKVWIQNNPPSVQLDIDAKNLPAEFKITIPVSYQADTKDRTGYSHSNQVTNFLPR